MHKRNQTRRSKKKSYSVSGYETLGRKNSRKENEFNSDAVSDGKLRTTSVSDSATNSKVGRKLKDKGNPNDVISRQGSSKKGSRKSSSNDSLPPDMMVMSTRRQQRIQINENLSNKYIDEEDDVFTKKVKNVKTENSERLILNLRLIYY